MIAIVLSAALAAHTPCLSVAADGKPALTWSVAPGHTDTLSGPISVHDRAGNVVFDLPAGKTITCTVKRA